MKIIHIDFTGPYTEGMSYQENLLPSCQVKEDREVIFLAPCIKWDRNCIVKVSKENKMMPDGVRLVRFPYISLGISLVTRALRPVSGIYQFLCNVKPDVIMLHGAQTLVTLAVCKYMHKYKKTRLVVDDHSDYNNSATNLITKYFVHRTIYRALAKKVEKLANVYYYITPETKIFLMREYHITAKKLSLLPLGGICFSEDLYIDKRDRRRRELDIRDDMILVVHSGKLDRRKKTIELLDAFCSIKQENARLVIIGQADKEIQSYIDECIKRDKRIMYLGWKSGDDLQEYLCAADIYAQPGTQSATLQNAICCKCAIVVYPYPSHKILVKGNGYYASDRKELKIALENLFDLSRLHKMNIMSQKLGENVLDYNVLAERVLEEEI